MNTRVLFLMLWISNSLIAQVNQFRPTQTEIDSIYSVIQKAQIEQFLASNPILVDISIAKRDSIFLDLINNYRISKGLGKLTYVATLDSACKLHTNWMLDVQQIGHLETSPNTDGKVYFNFTDGIQKYDEKWLINHRVLFENCGMSKCTFGNTPTIQYNRLT